MHRLTISRSRPTVVVGLDFGTTFSGFAFALTSEPDEVHKFYEWPDLGAAGGGHYCKTLTSLLYETEENSRSDYVLQDWGYSALLKHTRGLRPRQPERLSYGEDIPGIANQRPPVPVNDSSRRKATTYLTLFKLHLVGGESVRPATTELPEGLTPRRVISDYLGKLSNFIMTEVQNRMGTHLTMEDVQWCLTVPAVWDDRSKQEMKVCASMAGMTKGQHCPLHLMDIASPHPVMIVLEPEAASLYCQRKVQVPLNGGDKFLIVDVGGGTVDLVLHEKIGSGQDLKVREASPSSGGLFGGSFVDQAFFEYISNKISCFQAFARTNSDSVLKLKGWWETVKYSFDGDEHFAVELELPARLARAWETDDACNNRSLNVTGCYDAIELYYDDMVRLFEQVVDGVLSLISKMMEGFNLKVMMIVGGFAGSPYLVKRIREEFSARVGTIVVPDEPGAAICCGAVQYGIYGADVIMSRMSKKTYGIDIVRRFSLSDPPDLMFQDDGGESLCKDVFSVFTRKNEEVPLERRVSHTCYPITKSQTGMSISLFSTSDLNPKYVCDPGVTKEGTFSVTFPSENELGEAPAVLISMYFGRTLIEVEAEGQNFVNGEKFKMSPVRFEKSFE